MIAPLTNWTRKPPPIVADVQQRDGPPQQMRRHQRAAMRHHHRGHAGGKPEQREHRQQQRQRQPAKRRQQHQRREARRRCRSGPGACSGRRCRSLGPQRNEPSTWASAATNRMSPRPLQVVAVDVGEIRPAPKPDHQHEARIARQLHQEDAADRRRADHLPDAGDALAQGLAAPRLASTPGGSSLTISQSSSADDDADGADAEEGRAPAEGRRWRRPAARSQTARRASRRQAECRRSVENRSGGEPARIERDRRHQERGRAKTKQRPRRAPARRRNAPAQTCTQPSTVKPTETSMQSFGPKRSSATPSGNWVAAKTEEIDAGQQAESGSATARPRRRDWARSRRPNCAGTG